MKPSPEFQIVEHLRALSGTDPGVITGIGDDAAVLAPTEGNHLVTCVDTLIEGVHFPKDTAAQAIGHKCLAVNLSDLAAMGARPRWATLALSLTTSDEHWVDGFAAGWRTLAERHQVSLVGGDTTRTPGPITATVQLIGELPPGQALTRNGAKPGDKLAVTGHLGGAALALQLLKNNEDPSPMLRNCLDRPQPRVAAGAALLPLASACIDLSDGLAADLPHILSDSGVGAEVDLAALPYHPSLEALPAQDSLNLVLAGGDDYELCFTYRPKCHDMIAELMQQARQPFSVIGTIESEPVLKWKGQGALSIAQGYGHFRG
ncbi:MAG: thiamine-phosphate kinase [Lysobacterales bacterium]